MIYLIIILTFFYFVSRICVLVWYLIANKSFNKESYLHHQIEVEQYEKEINETPYLANNEVFKPVSFPYISQKSKKLWIFLYKLDFKIKSLGTILISILSIILLLINQSESNKNLLLVTAILPSLVQLFNEIISWFEIDKPNNFEPVLPKRFFCKVTKKP